ncbi:MAG: anthranilate phosphoribosyltransferase [Planctomycetota bacterium]|nr:anthranilate phosphoribosyltransferase [Planctomycetota bacterium]
MASPVLHEVLGVLGKGLNLTAEMSRHAVSEIIDGLADPVSIASFLTALRIKGESADDLAGAVLAVRSRMMPIEIPDACRPLLDTCGTGGDGANTVNISTAAAIVVAACGIRVAKHGNRSASGNSGSAEVLTELGVRIDAAPHVLIRCLEELGITFLYAPRFHPALKHVSPIRRQLPFRTLFNLIGPLANPARPDFQLIGVPDRERMSLLALSLSSLDVSDPRVRAFVVAGADGLDEVSLSGWNHVEVVGDGFSMRNDTWGPSDFGLPEVLPEALRVSGPSDSAAKIRAVFEGDHGPIRDVILANASAALYLVHGQGSIDRGTAIAAEAIDRGDAAALLERWAELSHSAD